MKLEVSTRSAELRASELRLENMEKDLVEISLSNENYRSQVCFIVKILPCCPVMTYDLF